MHPNEFVARNLLLSMQLFDAEKMRPFISDDIVYWNGPLGPIVGADAFVETYDAWFRYNTHNPMVAGVQHVALAGDYVIVERLDIGRVRQTNEAVNLPAAGILQVRDGKICYWRDYLDRLETCELIGEKLAGLNDVLTEDASADELRAAG